MQRPRSLAGKPAPEIALAATTTEVAIRSGLVAGLMGSYGRSAVPSDFLAWQIATGAFREPREGDVLKQEEPNRSQTWTLVEAGADGWIASRALNGGYLYTVINV